MTATGMFIAPAIKRWPTPLVLNKPPWPIRFIQADLLLLGENVHADPQEAMVENSCALKKLARVIRLSGVRTNMGQPLSKPVIGSPET